MKLIFLLLLVASFASLQLQAQYNYNAQWKQVDALIQKKKLPKSALVIVKKIYAQAKKDDNNAQRIKALIYQLDLQNENRENNELLAIKEVEKELMTSSEPYTYLLNSMLAGLYWKYFQEHRWQLYERTATEKLDSTDITKWSIEDFHKKITTLYLASLQNEKLLQQIPIDSIRPIIVFGNTAKLRPTLYDLLVHEAIDYFRNDETEITRPANRFEIDDSLAFATAVAFSTAKFMTTDSTSLQHKALQLFQDLIRFHLSTNNNDALLDADIARLEFVYQNATMPEKGELYSAALKKMITDYADNKAINQANYLLASYHNESGDSYNYEEDTTHRFAKVEAVKILETVVADSAIKNEGWVNSFNKLQDIKKPDFGFSVEKINLPNEPFRAKIDYRNVARLYVKLLPYTDAVRSMVNDYDNNWKKLSQVKAIKVWQQALPQTGDYQTHSVEIKIDALPLGEYLLLASSDAGFKEGTAAMAAQNFFVSNISYVYRDKKFFVLHRKTGHPLAAASVAFVKEVFDKKKDAYIKKVAERYTSDANGFFNLEKSKEAQSNVYFDLRYKNDRLNTEESIYMYRSYQAPKENIQSVIKRVYFFTDRAIYRPGQKVFFKGLLLNEQAGDDEIAVNETGKVYLLDANYQLIDSIEKTTNAFGSLAGEFTLPSNLLNGSFTIQYGKESYNRTYISVEEYKRPKFDVTFEKIKKAYKLRDSINITGTAKAFAGNFISDATVQYTITRTNQFHSYKSWLPQTRTQIKSGETVVANNGEFSISFAALPDAKIDSAENPTFLYEVTAIVTDVNGETHSATEWVTVGYSSIVLAADVASRMPADSLKTVLVNSTNHNDEFVKTKTIITISKLLPEQRLIRKRLWTKPDQFVMSKPEFITHFPYDEYNNETAYETWQKTLLQTVTDSTNEKGIISLSGMPLLQAGHYAIDVALFDDRGKKITTTLYTELYDEKNPKPASPENLWVATNGKWIEPGEEKKLLLGTSLTGVHLIKETNRKSEKDNSNGISFGKLNAETKQMTFPATEADRGGYSNVFFFVKENRFYEFEEQVNVGWSNKELKVEFTSFRNKTEPGTKETIKVKISGYKETKPKAEMLASMYDASLDNFREHNWRLPPLWNYNTTNLSWSDNNFGTTQAEKSYVNSKDIYHVKSYSVLLFNRHQGQPFWWLNPYRYVIRDGSWKDVGYYYGLKSNLYGAPPPVETAKFIGNLQGRAPGLMVAEGQGMADLTAGLNYSVGYMFPAKQKSYDKESESFFNIVGRAVLDSVSATPKSAAIQPRKNLSETAFFFPTLTTNDSGEIEFSFTAPEALTKWKLQTFAHTKELAFAYEEKGLLTQKSLMVQPNLPRFARQKDTITIQVKIANLSADELQGEAMLQLFDAATNEPVKGFQKQTTAQSFNIKANNNAVVNFPLVIPENFNSSLTWRITATAGNGKDVSYSDGEEASLPVLPHTILVTETLPLVLRGNATKEIRLDKLLQSASSTTIKHQSLTVEATTNPAWYVVQALPYLMEFPYECAEQTWNRYYANALAASIATSSPRIQTMFEKWRKDTTALQSNLQKNEELKSVLLQETPWVNDALSEAALKRNIGLLFDKSKTQIELSRNLAKLKQMQKSSGAFPWFDGGSDNRYITQYILTGIGRLMKLKGLDKSNRETKSMVEDGLNYLDKEIQSDYQAIIKSKQKASGISSEQIQYLYMRSFFENYPMASNAVIAATYFKNEAVKNWQNESKQLQAMIVLALHRTGNIKTPAAILASLKETAIISEERGMYWKEMESGRSWYWRDAPIETAALMIEAFTEAGKDKEIVAALQTWLIQNKQTNNWATTKATADACYAVLLQNPSLLNEGSSVSIKLGDVSYSSSSIDAEEGTGYFKKTILSNDIKPGMGMITVAAKTANNTKPVWANVYWQYFENLDKIMPSVTPLTVNKEVSIQKITSNGPQLVVITNNTQVKVGDKLIMRIHLTADREMEYVQLKDLRASGFEPLNVFSGYRWQNGTGYYETTKDASTNFFFDKLPKGSYVFEYPVYVAQSGNFSNGIATVQCMYAPQFSAHSEGVRVEVK